MSKVIMAILGIVMLFLMMPIVMTSLHGFQTDEYTQIEVGVVTGGGDTDTEVTLDYELWQDEIQYVNSVSSNETGDSGASADSYVSATQVLTIDGLAVSTTRTLTIDFDTEALEGYTGLSELTSFAPMLIVMVGIIGLLFGAYKIFT